MSEEAFRTFFITHVYLIQHAIYYDKIKCFNGTVLDLWIVGKIN